MMADLTLVLESILIIVYVGTATAAGILSYQQTGRTMTLDTMRRRERITNQFEMFLIAQLVMLFGFVSLIVGGANHIGGLLDLTLALGTIYIGIIFIGCMRWVIQGW